MSSLTFQRLHIFFTITQQGSFNKAAEVLYLSQAAVSQHMQGFEAAIGNTLFERSPRGVTLTPTGERLLTYAQEILPLIAEAESAIVNVAALQNETLKIGATPGLSVYRLPDLLSHFQLTYPNIGISMQSSLTTESIDKVKRRAFDFGLVEGELTDLDLTGIEWRALEPVRYLLTVYPEHPWAAAGVVSLKALAEAPFLHRQPTSRSRRWIERTLAAAGIELGNIVAEFDSPGAIKYGLFNSLGVSILPEYALARELKNGDLVRVDFAEIDFVRPVKLIWEAHRPHGPVQQAFLTDVNRHYK